MAALCESKSCKRMKVHSRTSLCPAIRKPRRVYAYMVYALVPVNVRVLARSKRGAERMGLRALNRTRPLELSSDDNATYQAMYIDDGAPAGIDESMKPSARVVTCSKSEAVTFINEEAR